MFFLTPLVAPLQYFTMRQSRDQSHFVTLCVTEVKYLTCFSTTEKDHEFRKRLHILDCIFSNIILEKKHSVLPKQQDKKKGVEPSEYRLCPPVIMFYVGRKYKPFSQFDLKITKRLLPAVCCGGTRVNQQRWVIAQQEARPQTTPCKSSGGWLYTACALPVYRHI